MFVSSFVFLSLVLVLFRSLPGDTIYKKLKSANIYNTAVWPNPNSNFDPDPEKQKYQI